MATKSMIKNLQALRGIVAILIFYHHYGFAGSVVTSFGDFGVTFFMILSGFVLYLSQSRNDRKFSLKKFMPGRIRKIYPLYLPCWIASCFVFDNPSSNAGIILGALMLQSWIPDKSIFFAGNGVAWFISDLIFCYLIFGILKKIIDGPKLIRNLIFGGYFIAYCAVTLLVPDNMALDIIYINPVLQLSNFIIGMVLCKTYISFTRHLYICKLPTILQLSSITITVVAIFYYAYIPERFSLCSYWWLVTPMCILIFAVTDTCDNMICRILHSKTLQITGNISFTLYMIHAICINIWQRGLHYIGISNTGVGNMLWQSIVLLLLLIPISYLINRRITKLFS